NPCLGFVSILSPDKAPAMMRIVIGTQIAKGETS
ncbi:MAG: hypothetical protein RL307_846, partial [Pseudomonadota bacterium]